MTNSEMLRDIAKFMRKRFSTSKYLSSEATNEHYTAKFAMEELSRRISANSSANPVDILDGYYDEHYDVINKPPKISVPDVRFMFSQTICDILGEFKYFIGKGDELWVSEQTLKFHQRTLYYPDSDYVIKLIRAYRQKVLTPSKPYWNKSMIERRAIERITMLKAIELITKEGHYEDPIRVLYKFQSSLNDMTIMSDSRRTWNFVKIAYDAISDLISDLG